MPLQLEFRSRSGGMGGGNLPKVEYHPPQDQKLRIIRSTIQGIKIEEQKVEKVQPPPQHH